MSVIALIAFVLGVFYGVFIKLEFVEKKLARREKHDYN